MESESASSPKLPWLVSFLLGVTLVGIIWLASYLSNQPKPSLTTALKTLSLTIASPKPNLATNQKEIIVSGQTSLSSAITISLGSQNIILKPTTYFATKITLNEGKNLITVTAFDPSSGSSLKQTREILYLNEDLSSL